VMRHGEHLPRSRGSPDFRRFGTAHDLVILLYAVRTWNLGDAAATEFINGNASSVLLTGSQWAMAR
jgi:hypothetical protein